VAGGPAAITAFVLSGEAVADRDAAVRVLDLRAPLSSTLLLKASGQKPHAGGAPWPTGGAPYGRVLAWIQGGARLDGAATLPIPIPVPIPVPAPAISAAAGVSARRPPASARGIPASPVPVPPPDTTGTNAGSTQAAPIASNPTPGPIDFATGVHPLLVRACGTCHGPVGPAAATRLTLSGQVDSDYAKVRALVTPQTPARSLLITKSAGEVHGGGVVVAVGSAEYLLLLDWIGAGATRRELLVDAPPAGAGPDPVINSTSTSVPVPVAPSQAPETAPRPELALPYGIAINGRFDLAYERRGFASNPFASTAVDALRSYHHFLFLSRESNADPIGIAVEILSLQFWEAHFRFRPTDLPIQIVIAAGKIAVPFGAEPLFHQSYGGLAGFDQRILPAIWAQQGLVVRAVAHHRELAITDDLYVVRGYALRQADGVINLQNDFSPEDRVSLGWGNRLGAAWGPLSAWYSTYYNRVGFGRRLVMQAADVMLSRVREVPVLGHFSFAAGLMRADVSGGDDPDTAGPGKDYYHFGSYFQARYHPTDWLYIQYRQGLRTFNNRRGLIVDTTRLTADDGSTHNFAVGARFGGLTAALAYFINLEKADEIPDDFLRASLTYDF
jgi:hypothetical protein